MEERGGSEPGLEPECLSCVLLGKSPNLSLCATVLSVKLGEGVVNNSIYFIGLLFQLNTLIYVKVFYM